MGEVKYEKSAEKEDSEFKRFPFGYDTNDQVERRLKAIEEMKPVWNYTWTHLGMMLAVIVVLQKNMFPIRTFLLSLYTDPLYVDPDADCADFLLGNKQLMMIPMWRRIAAPIFLYSLRLAMMYGCHLYNNGNETMHYISKNVFKDQFAFWYGMFMFCLSTISPQFCAYSEDFYSAFNAERLGHLLYESHDIFSLMRTPKHLFEIHPGLYYVIHVQFWGGIWESLAHEVTGFGMTRESSLTLDTFHPGLLRAVLGVYVFMFKYGPRVNWEFIKKSSPAQWHYLIWRLWAGFGAFSCGFLGFYAPGYRAEYYGMPDLQAQLKCEKHFHDEVYNEHDEFSKQLFELHKEHNIGFSSYSLAFEHHHSDGYCTRACEAVLGH